MLLKDEIINSVNDVEIVESNKCIVIYCDSLLSKTLKKVHHVMNLYKDDLSQVADQTGIYLNVSLNLTNSSITIKECSD